MEINNQKHDETGKIENEIKQISSFRRYLPQILAGTAKNLLLYDLGAVVGFQTILIGSVLNADEGLSFTSDQASWFASLLFIGQLVGTLTAGLILEPIGRKKSLVLLNIPLLIGWLAICSEYSVFVFCTASIILGLSLGSVEAPAITYIGEISEPKIRGILTSYSELSVGFGILTVYLLGINLKWQTVAYLCATLPVISAAIISQIPESPIWLLSHGQNEEAEKALCWLRGWVEPENIKEEFSELVSYRNKSINESKSQEMNNVFENKVDLRDERVTHRRENITKDGNDSDSSSDGSLDLYKHRFYSIDLGNRKSVVRENMFTRHAESDFKNSTTKHSGTHSIFPIKESKSGNPFTKFAHDLARPNIVRPLLFMTGFFFFCAASGYIAIRPFIIMVFEELGFAVDPYKAAPFTIFVLCCGKVTCMLSVRTLGKRHLALLSSLGSGGTCIALGIYALKGTSHTSWIPVILYLLHVYAYGLGLGPIPWMYLSEVFPFRGRAAAAGLAAGICYIFIFFATKTFLSIKSAITLPGSLFLYGAISLLGLGYIYFLPETEGKSLQDIENNNFNKNKS